METCFSVDVTSVATFAAELGKAEWRSIWIQLLGWGFITAIIAFFAWWLSPITINVLSIIPCLQAEAIQRLVPHIFYDGQPVSVPLGLTRSKAHGSRHLMPPGNTA